MRRKEVEQPDERNSAQDAEGKRKTYPTFGFIMGVLLMLYLDTAFSPS
jgi:hypothetical protein